MTRVRMGEGSACVTRWARAGAWIRVTAMALAGGMVAAGAHGGCKGDQQPFECGVALAGDEDVIRYCAGEHEVCICATNYCAKPDTKGECKSGYRYLEQPYGAPCEDGSASCPPCVDEAHYNDGATVIREGRKDACTLKDAGTDSGSGGGGGGSGSGGGGGGSGSGSGSGGGGGGGGGGSGSGSGGGGMGGSGGVGGGP